MRFSIACIVGLAFLAGAAAYWAWWELHTPAPLPPGGAMVSIGPGEPFGVTSARLYGAGVVRQPRLLRLWARWYGLDRLVRSGDYRFDEPLAPVDVLARLRSPAAALHRVTIPEGSTLRQVAALLATAGFGGTDQFLCLARDPDFLVELDLPASGLEGYAFPDTYAFAWSTPPEEILRTMVGRFREQAAALQTRRVAAGMSEHGMVILGSLIEKETGAAQERAMVSAVFHNRLRLGMLLQSDPTAVYERQDGAVPTAADLSADTPYNTYRNHGLPPGPICNPGRAALDAALAPAAVSYLYFVSRNDGSHEFSTTLEEHSRAVARFQRTNRANRSAGP
ncbi:MAG TPA: endolytic transglycosylase MltG [Candidatus Margulisiibacteriota bacterium]|nr:endolytic transglycosylase MltG [Candidatus Margulisiibacteriota bacterium]